MKQTLKFLNQQDADECLHETLVLIMGRKQQGYALALVGNSQIHIGDDFFLYHYEI